MLVLVDPGAAGGNQSKVAVEGITAVTVADPSHCPKHCKLVLATVAVGPLDAETGTTTVFVQLFASVIRTV